jgi:nitroreductase
MIPSGQEVLDLDAMEALLTRRSIRKYKQGDVPDNVIEDVLTAAMSAPSAGNEQAWQFVVIRDHQTLVKMTEIHQSAQMLKEAALAILVCGDLSLQKYKDWWPQDCSAAMENLLLAVHASGFSSVWLGVYPRQERIEGLRKLLGLPEHVVPFAIAPIGVPGEKKGKENRYTESKVHHDKW